MKVREGFFRGGETGVLTVEKVGQEGPLLPSASERPGLGPTAGLGWPLGPAAAPLRSALCELQTFTQSATAARSLSDPEVKVVDGTFQGIVWDVEGAFMVASGERATCCSAVKPGDEGT